MKSGKGYSVNVPLRDGINDDSFHQIFKPVSDFFSASSDILGSCDR